MAQTQKGRPRSLNGQQLQLAEQLYYNEGLSVRKVADAMGVSHMTIYRALISLPPLGEGTQ